MELSWMIGNFQTSKFFNIRERDYCCLWPQETTICYKISLVQWLITNLNVILYLSKFHVVYISVLTLCMILTYLITNTYVSLMYELKKKLERYLGVHLLGSRPRHTKKEFTGPPCHKVWETLLYRANEPPEKSRWFRVCVANSRARRVNGWECRGVGWVTA
jgi:hypothetical protein